MAVTGVRVTGLNETVRALQKLGVEVTDLKDVFSGIAAEGARLASSFAPRRTGNLAASVRGNKAKNKAVVIAGKAKVPYAGAINYGWRKRGISPAGFMQKADTALGDQAVKMLEDGIADVIRRNGLGG